MSNLSTLPKGDSAWLLRKAIERIIQQVSVLETNIGASTSGNSANTQIIFNDNGTLRGDAGLVYNKTTDALTVAGLVTAGSATITGDLTVDTNTLYVNSSLNRVGIGTASPATILDIQSAGSVFARIQNTASSADAYLLVKNTVGEGFFGINATGPYIYTAGSLPITFTTATSERYRIAADGIATWSNVGGVAGTAMTLNSTGLGIGASPASYGGNYKTLAVNATDAGILDLMSNSVSQFRIFGNGFENRLGGITNVPLTFHTNNSEKMQISASGNVGIGVTPSAWFSTWKVLQLAGGSFGGPSDRSFSLQNAIVNASGQFQYVSGSSTPASGYRQFNGAHDWYTAAAGTSPNQITDFSSPKMTLDASGNLLCGVTSAIFNSRLRVKTSSTSASDYGVYVADSADAPVFALRNDGLIYTGTKTASPYNNTTASAANVFVAADGTLGRSTSSLKYKKDVKDSIHGLADVLKLRSVTYKSKNGDDTVFGGLIAEEVHAAGLTEFVAYAPDKTPDSINYGNMVSLLVSAIKELTARVQTLEAK